MDIAYHRGDSPQNEMRKMTENEIKEIALEEGEVLKIKVNGEIISILNRERIGLEVMMKDTIDLIWCDTDKDGNELTGHQSLNKFDLASLIKRAKKYNLICGAFQTMAKEEDVYEVD